MRIKWIGNRHLHNLFSFVYVFPFPLSHTNSCSNRPREWFFYLHTVAVNPIHAYAKTNTSKSFRVYTLWWIDSNGILYNVWAIRCVVGKRQRSLVRCTRTHTVVANKKGGASHIFRDDFFFKSYTQFRCLPMYCLLLLRFYPFASRNRCGFLNQLNHEFFDN